MVGGPAPPRPGQARCTRQPLERHDTRLLLRVSDSYCQTAPHHIGVGLHVDGAVTTACTIPWLPPVNLPSHGDDVGTRPTPAGGAANPTSRGHGRKHFYRTSKSRQRCACKRKVGLVVVIVRGQQRTLKHRVAREC